MKRRVVRPRERGFRGVGDLPVRDTCLDEGWLLAGEDEEITGTEGMEGGKFNPLGLPEKEKKEKRRGRNSSPAGLHYKTVPDHNI